jgi:hypothetical protein
MKTFLAVFLSAVRTGFVLGLIDTVISWTAEALKEREKKTNDGVDPNRPEHE